MMLTGNMKRLLCRRLVCYTGTSSYVLDRIIDYNTVVFIYSYFFNTISTLDVFQFKEHAWDHVLFGILSNPNPQTKIYWTAVVKL